MLTIGPLIGYDASMKLAQYIREAGVSAASFGRLVGVNNRQTMFKYVREERLIPFELAIRITEHTEGKVTLKDMRPDVVRLFEKVAA